jgi:hypothetical protein
MNAVSAGDALLTPDQKRSITSNLYSKMESMITKRCPELSNAGHLTSMIAGQIKTSFLVLSVNDVDKIQITGSISTLKVPMGHKVDVRAQARIEDTVVAVSFVSFDQYD